jgi:hypothetical protein
MSNAYFMLCNAPGTIYQVDSRDVAPFREHMDGWCPYPVSEAAAGEYVSVGDGETVWMFYFWNTQDGSIPGFVPVNVRTPRRLVPGTRRLDPTMARERVLAAPQANPRPSIRKAQNALQWARTQIGK